MTEAALFDNRFLPARRHGENYQRFPGDEASDGGRDAAVFHFQGIALDGALGGRPSHRSVAQVKGRAQERADDLGAADASAFDPKETLP